MAPILEQIQRVTLPAHDQKQSRLFALPYDIRSIIYDAVFTPNVVHLVSQSDPQDPKRRTVRHNWYCVLKMGPTDCPSQYMECIDLVYSRHTFSFNQINRSVFWTFYRTVPLCYLNSLRSLRLLDCMRPPPQTPPPQTPLPRHHSPDTTPASLKPEYSGAWEAIAGLPNLRTLLVTLSNTSLEGNNSLQSTSGCIITPMSAVQQNLERFDVEAFEMDVSGIPKWAGMNPACRLIWVNENVHNPAVGTELPTEREIIDLASQFGESTSEREREMFQRWEGAQDGKESHQHEIATSQARDARRELKKNLKAAKAASNCSTEDLEEINRVINMTSEIWVFAYLYRYPERRRAEPPAIRYLYGA
ncbi:hypothetical protein BJX70DRAFT_399079 [Aspergillus crustosus]